MSEPITVVLLDDHPLVMEGLNNRLNREPGIQVMKTFSDPLLFLSEVEALRPDVVVMDIRMPQLDGFEVVRRLKDQYGLSVKIILLSGYNYHEFQLKAYDLGVHAYLSKQATYGQIINAIHQSMLGHVLVPETMLSSNLEESLTATEREVLNRIALEMTNKKLHRIWRSANVQWSIISPLLHRNLVLNPESGLLSKAIRQVFSVT